MRTRLSASQGFPEAAARFFLGVVPLLSVPVLTVMLLRSHNFAFDFHGWYWVAGHRVLHGLSPYNVPLDKAFDYPAVGAVLFVPFALLPHTVADWLFTTCVVAAIPASLRLLGVRDWRVYGVVMLWQPVIYGWETANVTLLLLLGVAAAWRYRERPMVAGALVALVVSVKLFLLPLTIWLIATRRYAALKWSAVTVLAANALAWPILGVNELPRYVRMLHAFTAGAERRGYSLISILLHQGIGQTSAYAVALLLAGALAVVGIRLGRRSDEHGAITAAVAASLVASPVVLSHYLALLIVPLALTRPRLSLAWGLPLFLWVGPVDHPADWQHAVALAVGAAIVWLCLRRPSGREEVAFVPAVTAPRPWSRSTYRFGA